MPDQSSDPNPERPPADPPPAAARDVTPLVRDRRGLIVAFVVVALFLLGGDLLLKWWSFERFAGPVDIPAAVAGSATLPARQMTVVPGVLAIKLVLNRGAVFGLGQGYTWLFLVITVVAVGFVGYVLLTSPADQRGLHLCLALILAGALGNMVDRVQFAAVRDMLYLFPGVELPFGWRWRGGQTEVYPWIFNLADVYLTVGILVLVVRSFLVPNKAAGR